MLFNNNNNIFFITLNYIFIIKLEAPYLIRKIALLVKPTVEVNYNEEIEEYDIIVSFFYFNYHTKFKLDVEVEEKIPFTGETIRKIVTKTDDGKFLSTQLTGKHAGCTFLTEITDDACIVTMTLKDVVAVRAYKKKVTN